MPAEVYIIKTSAELQTAKGVKRIISKAANFIVYLTVQVFVLDIDRIIVYFIRVNIIRTV